MRIDLHTHSNCSDGTDTPAELITKAKEAGLDVVALTDHDTYSGWDEARATAERVGIEFVPGVEISTKFAGKSIHLLGYWPDPDNQDLTKALDRILSGRVDRIPTMVERLNAADGIRDRGIQLTEEDVTSQADGPSVGRPHAAKALVAKGVVHDIPEAFDRFLISGKPGYVPHYSPEPAAAIQLVLDAHGVPVIAHPRGHGAEEVMTDDVLRGLKDAGLVGIEVDHKDHDGATRAHLRDLAKELGLIVTGSSDYHGTNKDDHDLGLNTTSQESYEALKAARGR